MFKRLLTSREKLEAVHCGCVDLLNTVQRRVRPRHHIFGHIHEGYGISTDGTTTFINASTCDVNYLPCNRPIVFDVPLPELHTKDEPLTWILKNKDCRNKDRKRNENTYRAEHARGYSIPEEDNIVFES